MKITRILLVSPNRFHEPYPVYPLALSYLKSSIEHHLEDVQVALFDFNLGDMEAFRSILDRFNPDLVGISLRNIDTVNIFDERHFIEETRELIDETRQRLNAITVIGGAGFSIFPQVIFDQIHPDYGIFGEGENSLNALIRALRKGEDVKDIEGLVYHDRENTIFNSRSHFCRDPQPIFDDQLVDYYWQTAGMLNLQSKRGCPYRCAYCTYPLIEGRSVRLNDPGKLVQSLKDLRERKGITYFFFTDSVFNIQNEFNEELAQQIIAADLDIQWGAYFTPHRLEPGLLELLKRSGLAHLEFGTESLSNSTLKAYNKHFRVEEIFETAAMCQHLSLHTAHFLIFGGPGETPETVEETIRNSDRIEKTVFFPYFGMRIYPNTQVYRQAVEEGKIAEDASTLHPVFYLADGLDFKEIKQKTRKAANRWIFPDDKLQKPMEMMRKQGVKGPLWEMLIK